ncbi:MAG: hypothetical protein K2X06_00875 [Burkholderiales bacterium]|nr:hypothetical protein [Burkholderiales bacterium]
MKLILCVSGLATVLSVVFVGYWFAVNVEDEVSWTYLLLCIFAGLICGGGFLLLALFGKRCSWPGRIIRVLGGLMLVFPAILFGAIFKEHLARLLDGGPFVFWSFAIACLGLLAVVLAVVYSFRAEINDNEQTAIPHQLRKEVGADRPVTTKYF